ncbi:hypothetical protein LAZ67_6000521 [Cordylochernes scorpioides]|uniref:Uncharacterized protein n=1 Tax=Cordylochernes scorpioides TaxID=51811 RepID=A0ABY6KIT1_9ARAC|nr:hypothetical protein LAZ67_6000521 [Cordylochernes scorpioides]
MPQPAQFERTLDYAHIAGGWHPGLYIIPTCFGSDLLRTIKAQCLQEWKSDAAHDWHRAGGTSSGSVLPREQQSLISRLESGHLRTMTFQNGCRVFPICTKCNSQPATPRHIIDCINSSIDELYSSPADTIKNLKLYKLDTLV